ncbi:DMT family transporter [Compostibacter hankyongensis]|uniref:DMT family transporter n=1 Tax=Compostibacter hankyongensis TaxID=1007089 RepID=A0ABP8G3A8_9BACT
MKKALLQLHTAVLLAGFTGVMGRLISLNEGVLVWYRLGITAFTLLLIFAVRRKIPRLPPGEIARIAFVGLLVALHLLCFYGSIKYANVSICLVCFSAGSFFSALTEPLLLRKRFNAGEALLSVIGMGGIYIILHFDRRYTTGIILGLAAAFLSALFTILNKKLTDRHTSQTITFYELGSGFLCLSLLMPFYLHVFPGSRLVPSWSDWGYLLLMSWCCTIWAYDLMLNAMKKVSPFTVNLTYNLEPVYGILLAFLIFKENRSLGQHFYMGLFLIFLSVAMQSWQTLRRHRKERLPQQKAVPAGEEPATV